MSSKLVNFRGHHINPAAVNYISDVWRREYNGGITWKFEILIGEDKHVSFSADNMTGDQDENVNKALVETMHSELVALCGVKK